MMHQVIEAKQDRQKLYDELKAHVKACEVEKRWTAGDVAKFDHLEKAVKDKDAEIARLEREAALDGISTSRSNGGSSGGPKVPPQDPQGGSGGWPPLKDEYGRSVRVLAPDEQLSRFVRPDQSAFGFDERPLSLGKYIRGIVTGHWEGAEPERRAMTEGTLSSGGYLAPIPLSTAVIDKARAKSQVLKAGARTIPMESGSLKIARVTAGPTAAWKTELAAIPRSDMAFELVTLNAQTVGSLALLSRELVDDAKNLEDLLSSYMADGIALELDRVALRGSGTPPEPRGVRNTTGVTITELDANGRPPTYADLSSAIQTIRSNNGEPNAIIYAPRTAGTLERLVDTTGQPLRPSASVEQIKTFVSGNIPINLTVGTSTAASEIYIGAWESLWIGVRLQLEIKISEEASDATDSAFRQFGIFVRAVMRADIAVSQPSHFVVLTGVDAV